MTAERARRVFLVCHGLRWPPTGLLVPIMVLLLTERGLSLTQVGFVFAVYGAATAVLELPTGALADTIGRKRVLVLASLMDAGLAVGLLLGQTLAHFLIAATVGGLGRALLTGPLESWYVDTARSADPNVSLRSAFSTAGVVEAVAVGLGALLSAALPRLGEGLPLDGTITLLSLPVIAALIANAVSLAAVLLLVVETPRVHAVGGPRAMRSMRDNVVESLRLAAGQRDLRLVFAGTFVAVTATVSVELLWQPRLAELLGGTEAAAQVNGFLVAGLSVASAAGSWAANRLPRTLAPTAPRAAAMMAVASAAALAWLAASSIFISAALAFLLLYATTAGVSVIRSELLHDRVSSEHRATMVSTLSMSQQAGNLVSSLTLVRLADSVGIPSVWAIAASLYVVQAALFARVAQSPGSGRRSVSIPDG